LRVSWPTHHRRRDGVFERLARQRSDAAYRAPGVVYCVIPGKPGCGGSTLAANLAVQMHSDGANPVLLVDGDQLTASIAFMLKLKPCFTWRMCSATGLA